jgi:hypothetical protein
MGSLGAEREPAMKAFLAWVDRRNFISVRAITVYAAIWMTWEVTQWAFRFADATRLDGTQTGLIIAAVTAPVCALQGFVFKFYVESRT